MIKPKYLSKGSTIAIVSTARKLSLKEVEPAISFLENEGFNVILGENLFEDFNQFAGDDNQRAADLQSAMDNIEVDAILCARGGYGTVRIIDKIDFTNFKKNPKWICGYSDVTVLHSHIHNLGIETLHATMPLNFPENGDVNRAMETLINSLKGESSDYVFKPEKLSKQGEVEAEICGGNLSILYSLMGSSSEIDTEGKILFIEDLDEYLYHIDRMMMNLKRAGKLDKLSALIVGGMNDMNDNKVPFGKSAYEIIWDTVKDYNYPVCFGFPAGHIEDNFAIKMGAKAVLKISEDLVVFQQ
ncbi:MAG: LD-carboxypeptidase [Bacteroidales bacterium]|jgi:muramoyltetrapeptide carboxypeptidase|nr:LD-carboxypeptidase [Bacteroidales bacterium]